MCLHGCMPCCDSGSAHVATGTGHARFDTEKKHTAPDHRAIPEQQQAAGHARRVPCMHLRPLVRFVEACDQPDARPIATSAGRCSCDATPDGHAASVTKCIVQWKVRWCIYTLMHASCMHVRSCMHAQSLAFVSHEIGACGVWMRS